MSKSPLEVLKRKYISPDAETGERWTGPWFRPTLYALILLLCLIAYHGYFDNWFFNDNFRWLKEARYDMKLGNILTYRVIEFFRPLTNLSFYIMERIAPGNPSFHNTLNFVLHLLNCVLVFHLLSALIRERMAAAAASALFAITSVHTGAVFWISARTTLLSTCLLLASLTVLVTNRRVSWPKITRSPSAAAKPKKGAATSGKRSRRGKSKKALPRHGLGNGNGSTKKNAPGLRPGGNRVRIAVVLTLYILALAAKETAITGLLLVTFVFFLLGERKRKLGLSVSVIAYFSAATLLYIIIRILVMESFSPSSWGLGAHMLRNIGGAFLYQLYPWPFIALFAPRLGVIPESTHPFMPEIMALPLLLILLWIGWKTNRLYEFALAIGWTLVSITPASLFRYRFFSTVSMAQNRYYYLSSVGSVLILVLLISILWRMKSRLLRIATAALFLIICVGYVYRVNQFEQKWDKFTAYYKRMVNTVIEVTDAQPMITTVVVEDSRMAFRYLKDAVALQRPEWKLVEVSGGEESALAWRPCMYIKYTGGKKVMMFAKKLE